MSWLGLNKGLLLFSNKGTTNLQVFFAPEPTDITGEPVILVLAGGKSTSLAGGTGYNDVLKNFYLSHGNTMLFNTTLFQSLGNVI